MKTTSSILKKKYKLLGLKNGQIVYLTSDFRNILGKNKKDNDKILSTHLQAIKQIIGKNGTIVVPAITTHLGNTDIVFDPKKTPSSRAGVFSEFIRKKKNSKRSLHPIWSVCSLGKLSNYFTKGLSNHSFGFDSVWTRLIEKKALSLHIGIHPRKSLSIIHYQEFMVGVPYRFTKEFNQYVKINNNIKKLKFYHFCLKKPKQVVKEGNFKIYRNFINKFKPKKVKKINFTKSTSAYLLPLKEFHEINLNYLLKNRYAWLKEK